MSCETTPKRRFIFKILLALGLLCLTPSAEARLEDLLGKVGASQTEIYTMSDSRKVEVQVYLKSRWRLNKGCELKPGTSCQAALALVQSDKMMVPEELAQGGAQPGAVICRKFFKAELETGVRDSNEEVLFCRFKDGSLTSVGSLDSAGQLNWNRRHPSPSVAPRK